MPSPARIAVVTGQGPAAHAVSGAVVSLLTALGRWVEEVPPGAPLAGFAAVLAADAAAWRTARAAYAGPLVVVDAGALDVTAQPSPLPTDGRFAPGDVDLGVARIVFGQSLPKLAGDPIDGCARGVAVRADDRTVYVLPVVLTPSFRTAAGFWRLAAVLDRALVALLGDALGPYVEPWPDGAPAARSLTCDLDDLTAAAQLEALGTAGRRGTLFACADSLPLIRTLENGFEVAGHGDVHKPFGDDATNLGRVDAMVSAFADEGRGVEGFSPPNLIYSSSLAPLSNRFRHLRLGYQGQSWRFFPTRTDGLVVTRVSFYTDFLHRYVGHDECGRLLASADAWSASTRALSVPCFHPGLWSGPVDAYLRHTPPPAWETTLREIAAWWERRAAALLRLHEGVASREAALRLVESTTDARVTALLGAARDATTAPAPAGPARWVGVAKRQFVVVPAAARPAVDVQVRLGGAWPLATVLPSPWRRRLLRVANGGGVTAGLYAALGARPDVRAGGVRLPMVVPDEPMLLTPWRWRELRRPPRRLGAESEVTIRA